jgi:hypothetical protein
MAKNDADLHIVTCCEHTVYPLVSFKIIEYNFHVENEVTQEIVTNLNYLIKKRNQS